MAGVVAAAVGVATAPSPAACVACVAADLRPLRCGFTAVSPVGANMFAGGANRQVGGVNDEVGVDNEDTGEADWSTALPESP